MDTIERAPARECQGAVMPAPQDLAAPVRGSLTIREAARTLGMNVGQVIDLIDAGLLVPLGAVAGTDGVARGGSVS